MAQTKPINVALQGGGSHGAFTWGVLDRLLEDGRLKIEGVSGCSAGGMNAVVMVAGLAAGGPDAARERLETFWRRVARAARFTPLRTPMQRMLFGYNLDDSPAYRVYEGLTRSASPYDFNPRDISVLRGIVEATVDFEQIAACRQHSVFLSATNVWTGRVKVFDRSEITSDVVMASACLPEMAQAVEIDGVPYWDGGFMGNPALFPLYRAKKTDDVLLVQINPIERRETPRTAHEITNRMNEITFNASLLSELRAIEFVGRLVGEGKLEGYRQLRMHRIGGGDTLTSYNASSKMNAEWGFLTHLRDLGREAAEQFLEENWDAIGKRSTLDLRHELGLHGMTALAEEPAIRRSA